GAPGRPGRAGPTRRRRRPGRRAAAGARRTGRGAGQGGPPGPGGRLHLGRLRPGDPGRLRPRPGDGPVSPEPGPRVGVVAEQLLRPVPGGIGRYVRALTDHLPAVAAADRGAVTWIVGRHPPGRLAAAGLVPAVTARLAWPGRVATRTWVTLRRPRLPAGVLADLDMVHATSAAVPPTGGRPLGATLPHPAPPLPPSPAPFPAAGRRYHDRAARIVAGEAARVIAVSKATADDLTELY